MPQSCPVWLVYQGLYSTRKGSTYLNELVRSPAKIADNTIGTDSDCYFLWGLYRTWGRHTWLLGA